MTPEQKALADEIEKFHIQYHNDISNIPFLISKAMDVNFTDSNGDTPLHLAVRKSLSIVQLLLEAGADVNYVDENSDSPLHLALRYKKTDMALAMATKCMEIKNLDNLDHSWHYIPVIHHAVSADMVGVVKVLLAKGVNINLLEPQYGRVPLHFACSKAMYYTLLTHGADTTTKAGYYPLESNHLGYAGVFSMEARGKIAELSSGKNWTNVYVENQHKIKQVILDEIRSTNPELFEQEVIPLELVDPIEVVSDIAEAESQLLGLNLDRDA